MGRRIAEETAQRFELPEEQAETLEFLVHKHLLMSHLGAQYDTSQTAVDHQVCRRGSHATAARYVALVTCADLAAVGPGRAQ